MLLDGSSWSPRLSDVPGPLKARRPLSLSRIHSVALRGVCGWRGVLPPASFHYENGAKRGQSRGPGTGRVKAAPALEPARRGTSSGVLASPRVAKVQACKVGIGPARRGKKAWSPLPLPGVAPIGPAAGPAPPSPGAPRPRPGAAPRPLPGRRGAPSSMKGIPLLSLAWVWTPLPRGRRGAEDGAQTWDPHHHR